MIDFKLTANGDIDIAQATQYPPCRLDFYMKPYPCLRLDFDTDVKRYNTESHGICFNLRTNVRNLSDHKITVPSVTKKAETAQEVSIRLKTELGEFALLPAIGSKLALERHNDIRSEVVQETVRQYAEEAIGDIAFEETPTVTVVRADDDGTRFRHETLKITIDTGNTTYFEDTI